jgi:hypothetical protein
MSQMLDKHTVTIVNKNRQACFESQTCRIILAPQVRLELTTLRLHFLPNFRLSVDYLINFSQSCRTLLEILLVWFPQSLVSARSRLPFNHSAGFAQDYHSKFL